MHISYCIVNIGIIIFLLFHAIYIYRSYQSIGIIISLLIPCLPGPTATKLIRDEGYTGVVIGVTGNTLPIHLETFRDSGADSVLPKPLYFNTLKEKLKGV